MLSLKLWPATEFNACTRFANLNKRLPWDDNSTDFVYMGEVLEHFTREDRGGLIAECFRVLKPGSTIRLRVPDNAQFWRNYLKEFDEIHAKPRSQWTSDHTRWVEMFFRDICVRRTIGGSFGHFHKWMYDEVSLSLLLQKADFASLERQTFPDSAIEGVEAVEIRVDLTMEGTKPRSSSARASWKDGD